MQTCKVTEMSTLKWLPEVGLKFAATPSSPIAIDKLLLLGASLANSMCRRQKGACRLQHFSLFNWPKVCLWREGLRHFIFFSKDFYWIFHNNRGTNNRVTEFQSKWIEFVQQSSHMNYMYFVRIQPRHYCAESIINRVILSRCTAVILNGEDCTWVRTHALWNSCDAEDVVYSINFCKLKGQNVLCGDKPQ